jgi:hypothetical protein
MLTALVFYLLLTLIALLIVIYSFSTGISPMPSSYKAKKQLLMALPNNIEGPIYELGAGWGTLAFPLAKQHPLCQVLAFEVSPIPWLYLKLRKLISKQKNITIIRKDFFKTNLSHAQVIVCYLYPKAMERLKAKFETELTPGTIILSNTFAIPQWTPIEIYELDDLYKTKIYKYRF